MCGIFLYAGAVRDPTELQAAFARTRHRGPDASDFITHYRYDNPAESTVPTSMVCFGFHRLAINDPTSAGEQPFLASGMISMANGEIWNHADLERAARYVPASGSDCEVLPHYFRHCQAAPAGAHPFETMCRSLDGVFGIVVYDKATGQILVGRDRLGIRSLYYATTMAGDLVVASELKSVAPVIAASSATAALPFPPGSWGSFELGAFGSTKLTLTPYWSVAAEVARRPPSLPEALLPRKKPLQRLTEEASTDSGCEGEAADHAGTYSAFCDELHDALVAAVAKRFMSDRPIGCVLSGGLDSTIITAIAVKLHRSANPDAPPLRTYTIGMEGGTDFAWARKAAKHLGTDHHEFVLTEAEFLEAIPAVVRQIESYDVTTVRASAGNWLLAKKIAELGLDTVVFCGDVADELLGGYRGFGLTADPTAFQAELVRMLTNIHSFDVLRAEKSFAGHGLEGRVPFGDRDVLDLVLAAPVEWLMWGAGSATGIDSGKPRIEKEALRRAFEGYLPAELLWRRKEAFSDGVSATTRSWHDVIQEAVTKAECTATAVSSGSQLLHVPPYDPESAWYRRLFDDQCGAKHACIIPYFWKQPFSNVVDPSARCLVNYSSG